MFLVDLDLYPFSLPLSVLEFKNSKYKEREYVYRLISDLVNGGIQLVNNKRLYVYQRPGEEDWIYQKRLDRFTYRNVIGKAVNDLVAKLSLGSLVIRYNDSDKDFWNRFLNNIDLKNAKDEDFIGNILRCLLKFQCAYLYVDKPQATVLIETELDAEKFDPDPYVEIIEPYKVLNWQDGKPGKKQWVKIRTIEEVTDRFSSEIKLKATWIFIDDLYKAVYSAYVKWGANGQLEVVNPKDVDKTTGEPLVALEMPVIEHGYGSIPIVYIEVPDHLWSCNQAFAIALEHLNLHNAKYDTAMISSYVQRTIKPQELQMSDQDLDNTYVLTRRDQDQTEKIISGNAYILKADEFRFNEATGKPVEMLEQVLDKLARQIEEIVGLASYVSDLGVVEQSGESKKFDLIVQEILLRTYGKVLIIALNSVLQLIKISKNIQSNDVYATGLNRFNLDNLEDLVKVATDIEPIETRLSPTALKLFYLELQSMLAKNATPQDESLISDETEQIWRSLPGVNLGSNDEDEE